MKRWFVTAAASGALLMSSVQPCAAQQEAAAEALFRSARQAADRGDWVTACDRFEESHRLEPAPGTVLNLAQCREKLGQVASAWKRYGEVVQRLPKTDPRVAYSRGKERELEAQVPRLTLVAPAGSDGEPSYRVTVNGMEVMPATFGVPLPFDPGQLSIRIEAEGRDAVERKLDIHNGEHLTEQLVLGPPSSASEPGQTPGATGAVAEGASRDSNSRPWGWVSLGVGAAGAGLAVAGFVWAGNEAKIVGDEAHCVPSTLRCDATGFAASNRGEIAVALGWIGVGVGVLGVGSGIFILTRPGGETVGVGVRPLFGGAALSIGGEL